MAIDIAKKLVDELSVLSGSGKNNTEVLDKCTENFYKGACAATVKQGSWCGSNDACAVWDKTYKYVGSVHK